MKYHRFKKSKSLVMKRTKRNLKQEKVLPTTRPIRSLSNNKSSESQARFVPLSWARKMNLMTSMNSTTLRRGIACQARIEVEPHSSARLPTSYKKTRSREERSPLSSECLKDRKSARESETSSASDLQSWQSNRSAHSIYALTKGTYSKSQYRRTNLEAPRTHQGRQVKSI